MDLNPLNQIDPVIIGAVIAIVALTYQVLKRVYFMPYIRVMEAREQRLEMAEEQDAQADAILTQAEEQAATVVESARERADRIVREARERAERDRRFAVEKAGEEVGRRLEEGRARIAQARDNELAHLRTEALECVGIACEKLIGDTDVAAVETAVDKLLARHAS